MFCGSELISVLLIRYEPEPYDVAVVDLLSCRLGSFTGLYRVCSVVAFIKNREAAVVSSLS